MNTALESLMREAPPDASRERADGGIVFFLLIGAGAALGFVILSSVLVSLLPTVESWAVSSVCYAAFILPVYLLHRRYTFASDLEHRRALPRYVFVQGMALILASMFSFAFHGVLKMPSLPAAFLVITLTSGINYLVLKGWAFAFEHRLEAVSA